MALFWSVVSFAVSIFFTSLLTFLLAMAFIAFINRTLGVRKLYIQTLLKLFEHGKKQIAIAQRVYNTKMDSDDEEYEEGEDPNGGTEANNKPGNLVKNNSLVIRREKLILLPDPAMNNRGKNSAVPNENTNQRKYTEPVENNIESVPFEFDLSDCFDYICTGVEAIIEDQVTCRFETEKLQFWNLLTRTSLHYEFISWKLTVIWMCGFFMRYMLLFPLRIVIFLFGFLWLALCTAIMGYVPAGRLKRWLNKTVGCMCMGILSQSSSDVYKYHNVENRPQTGICVANHTSILDLVALLCDNAYTLVGQRHSGFIGLLQRVMDQASPHIWFERSERNDRSAVVNRFKKHVSNPKNPPILNFPEGTFLNNTSVMQFKKGCFEVASIVHPIAIKYDRRFVDAYWNTTKDSVFIFLCNVMTSWAVVCDVWYLPPMQQKDGESSIEFANRVKHAIAEQAGLVDLTWGGELKRSRVKPEWKLKQQEEFSKRLKLISGKAYVAE